MEPQFFGQFLLEQKAITEEQLAIALQYQKKHAPRLGELAVQCGYINSDQLNAVLKQQKDIDRYFGEIALHLGFLTETQLKELVTKQRNNHIFLGEALIQTAILSQERIETYLEQFHSLNDPINVLGNCVPFDTQSGEEILTTLDVTVKMFKRFAGLDIKIGQGAIEKNNIVVRDILVQIPFDGDIKFSYFLNFSFRARNSLLKIFENDTIPTDERINDKIIEFSSAICNFLNVHLIEMGHSTLKLSPITYWRTKEPEFLLDNFKRSLFFPCMIPDGPVGIYIAFM